MRLGSMAGLALAVTLTGFAGDAQTARPAPNNYGQGETWLCRPGRNDACDVDLTATVVAANGSFTRESFARNASAPVDCFYVYPTASADTTPNSDMIPGPEEIGTVSRQVARFGSV